MKQSQTFIPTLREASSSQEEEAPHRFLMRAGYIRPNGAGAQSILPLGSLVLRKMKEVIREELESSSAVEYMLPALQPASPWQQTGRDSSYGRELFTLQDRNGKDTVLAPSYLEMAMALMAKELESYKKLPLTFYQIRPVFRDEKNSRKGLMHSREGLVAEAFSFTDGEEKATERFGMLEQNCSFIFAKLGIDHRIIKMEDCYTFIAISPAGEEKIAFSDASSYAAPLELAEVREETGEPENTKAKELEKVATPDARTAGEAAELLAVPKSSVIKTLVYQADDQYVVVLVRGDHEISEPKLSRFLQRQSVRLANKEEVTRILGVPPGSIGPVKLPVGMQVFSDRAVAAMINGVCGANEDGFHLINVNPDRDFAVDAYGDLRLIREGDPSPDGYGTIHFMNGTELARIRRLGTKSSEKIGALFTAADGKSKPLSVVECELDVYRLLATLAEQYHDEYGLKWPKQVAPYHIHLITVDMKDDVQRQLSEDLYSLLKTYRYDILHDDRDERAGVKFADADLIGLPIRLVVGKKAASGIIEIKFRETGEMVEWQKEEVTEKLQSFFAI